MITFMVNINETNPKNHTSNTIKEYNDCKSSINICELKDYHFKPNRGYGKIENLNTKEKGFNETNSVWLKLEVIKGSSLQFTIIPDKDDDDIDFVLYESQDNTCKKLIAIRELMSGKTIGHNTKDCLGNTGLRYGDYDKFESKGCNKSKDNFAAPAELNDNNSYFILINNYDSDKGFTIIFEENNSLILKDNCNPIVSDFDFSLYPNPATEVIKISSKSMGDSNIQLEIIDILGRICYSAEEKYFNNDSLIDVSFLPASQYFVRITKDQEVRIKPFLKK